MLLISLIVSAVLLAMSVQNYRSGKGVMPSTVIGGAAFSVAPIFVGCFMPAVIFQAIILVVVTVYCELRSRRPRDFIILACFGSALPYLLIGWLAYREIENARERYPYESMVARLPTFKKTPAAPLKDNGSDLTILETSLDQGMTRYDYNHRRAALEGLHERTVEMFLQQPGFGVMRMPSMSMRSLESEPSEPTPPQPGIRPSESVSSADFSKSAQPDPSRDENELRPLDAMHRDGIIDFVGLPTFGFFKDRDHVAGFQAHRFTKVPNAGEHWKLRTVDLIGLVVHEEPVVYVSKNLPRMDELGNAPKRPPDGFELRGLEALRGGEDMFVRDAAGGQRALGAIRCAKQCVNCHAAERGHLLGAFSYTLTRRGP